MVYDLPAIDISPSFVLDFTRRTPIAGTLIVQKAPELLLRMFGYSSHTIRQLHRIAPASSQLQLRQPPFAAHHRINCIISPPAKMTAKPEPGRAGYVFPEQASRLRCTATLGTLIR